MQESSNESRFETASRRDQRPADNWEPPKFTAAVVPANGIFWGGRGLVASFSIADAEPC
jgi:hypothetical protein